MNPKNICRIAILLVLGVAGTLYVASAFNIAQTVGDWLRPAPDNGTQFLSRLEFVRVAPPTENRMQAKASGPEQEAFDKEKAEPNPAIDPPGKPGQEERFVAVLADASGSTISARSVVADVIQWSLFLAFLAVPCVIARQFLVRPLKEFPEISPKTLEALQSDDDTEQEMAATVVARAILFSLDGLQEGNPRFDALLQDKEELENALQFPLGRATVVRKVLERREEEAKAAARKYAQMAGLTVAISSSAMGDGIGMFFWKARLVHETFCIYGFRPGAWTVLRIYAYVLFSVFLAASVEDLCEMLDASEVLGGFGVRVLQGVLGAAIILKGGQLTRSYLTQGISAATRKVALDQFRETAMVELKAIGESVGNSLHKIGADKLLKLEDSVGKLLSHFGVG